MLNSGLELSKTLLLSRLQAQMLMPMQGTIRGKPRSCSGDVDWKNALIIE